jgi:hypothetical protein
MYRRRQFRKGVEQQRLATGAGVADLLPALAPRQEHEAYRILLGR